MFWKNGRSKTAFVISHVWIEVQDKKANNVKVTERIEAVKEGEVGFIFPPRRSQLTHLSTPRSMRALKGLIAPSESMRTAKTG